jgi:hypothetical protein
MIDNVTLEDRVFDGQPIRRYQEQATEVTVARSASFISILVVNVQAVEDNVLRNLIRDSTGKSDLVLNPRSLKDRAAGGDGGWPHVHVHERHELRVEDPEARRVCP